MSAIDTLLARLPGVKAAGKGKWMARCPAHEDGSPSLSIRETGDGRILLYDFGGCETGDVLDALRLQLTDLFSEPIAHHRAPIVGGFSVADLLDSISHEVFVARLIIEEAKDGELTDLALKRLDRAVIAITRAHELSR